MDPRIATVLCAALVVAVVTDIRSQRIPNFLTFSVILIGIGFHAVTGGVDGLLFSLGGFALGLGVLIIPYLLGIMGGGDVKLMAAVGACLGVDLAFASFLYTCLAGGVYALLVMAFRKGLFRKVFGTMWNDLMSFAFTGEFSVSRDASGTDTPRLCYGVAIAAGTFLAMALTVWESVFPG